MFLIIACILLLYGSSANTCSNEACVHDTSLLWCFANDISYAQRCCDTRNGPFGDERCWNHEYTFKFCCGSYESSEKLENPSSLKAVDVTHHGAASNAAVVDKDSSSVSVESGDGDIDLQDSKHRPFTQEEEEDFILKIFDVCFSNDTAFFESCCDPRKRPIEGCWSGEYTFKRCCSPLLRANRLPCFSAAFGVLRCCNPDRDLNAGCWHESHEQYGYSFKGCCAPVIESFCSLTDSLNALALTAFICFSWACLALGVQLHAPSSRKAEGRRLALIDNAKICLQILVIAQHWPPPYRQTLFGDKSLWSFAGFHTRTLCFLSGWASRKDPTTQSLRLEHDTLALLIPFVSYCLFIEPILNPLCGGLAIEWFELPRRCGGNLFLQRDWGVGNAEIWYLPTLCFWRWWALLLSRFRPFQRVCVAILFYMVAAYKELGNGSGDTANGGVWLLGVAVAYFPVYIVGQLFPVEEILHAFKPSLVWKLVGASLLALAYSIQAGVDENLMKNSTITSAGSGRYSSLCSYEQSSMLWIHGLLRHALELTKGLVFLVFCCPRSPCFLTELGQHSIYAYVLQFPILSGIAALQNTGFWPWHVEFIVNPLTLTFFLASKPVRIVFKVLIRPSWLDVQTVNERHGVYKSMVEERIPSSQTSAVEADG